MSMTLDVGDDRDETDELDDDERDDDDDEGERSSRKSARRTSKRRSDDDDDESDDEDDDDDKSPEELRAELKRLRAAVQRSGKQTARQRAARKELEKQLRSSREPDDEDDDEDDEDEPKAKAKPDALSARAIQKRIDRARREERAKAEDEHRRDLINTRAESALTRAGVSEKSARLLIKELDLEEIDFDAKTRSIDGLDEEIDRLKDEFPDLFRRKREGRRRINGGDERDSRDAKRKPMTATERQAAQLRGRSS